MSTKPIPGIENARTLAEAIVDTIHEPLLVLDGGLRVLAASRAFYEIFKVDSDHTMGCPLYDLGDGQWNIPALRELLETIIPTRVAMDGFEVEHDFPGVGRRTMMLKARKVTSEESRGHLRDAHQRVLSVAEVQSHLHATGGVDQIAVGPYLTKLCASLSSSMIGEGRPIAIVVEADDGLIGSDKAVSLGLIVTELVINSIKYAFPDARPDARVTVSYASEGGDWTLTVADNGVGLSPKAVAPAVGGLGTAIVEALVKQLDAKADIRPQPHMTVTIAHRAGVTSAVAA